MATNCPVCGAPEQTVLPQATVYKCCNTFSYTSGKYVGICDNAYSVALKMREALTFYATAMASDVMYDGGAKARVALLPVVQ